MSQTRREESSITHIQAVKVRYEADLLKKANVIGVGIGLRVRQGRPVGGPGIIVNVTRKVPSDELHPNDRIPNMLEDVSVWVEVVGEIRAQ
jgi:hypothetical protein